MCPRTNVLLTTIMGSFCLVLNVFSIHLVHRSPIGAILGKCTGKKVSPHMALYRFRIEIVIPCCLFNLVSFIFSFVLLLLFQLLEMFFIRSHINIFKMSVNCVQILLQVCNITGIRSYPRDSVVSARLSYFQPS